MSGRTIRPKMTAKHRAAGESLAKIIDKALPDDTGFALLIVDYGNQGELSYIANVERDDMIATMKDFIAASEGRAFPAPARKQ